MLDSIFQEDIDKAGKGGDCPSDSVVTVVSTGCCVLAKREQPRSRGRCPAA